MEICELRIPRSARDDNSSFGEDGGQSQSLLGCAALCLRSLHALHCEV